MTAHVHAQNVRASGPYQTMDELHECWHMLVPWSPRVGFQKPGVRGSQKTLKAGP